jgi:hypothetical protein
MLAFTGSRTMAAASLITGDRVWKKPVLVLVAPNRDV